LGCWVVVFAHWLALPAAIAITVGAVVTISIRLAVIIFGWRVPSWRV
jgi:uncharacterized membrane protein YeiH